MTPYHSQRRRGSGALSHCAPLAPEVLRGLRYSHARPVRARAFLAQALAFRSRPCHSARESFATLTDKALCSRWTLALRPGPQKAASGRIECTSAFRSARDLIEARTDKARRERQSDRKALAPPGGRRQPDRRIGRSETPSKRKQEGEYEGGQENTAAAHLRETFGGSSRSLPSLFPHR